MRLPLPARSFACTLAFVASSLATIASASPLRDDVPPEVEFSDASGAPVKLSDFRGRQALVLLFMRGFTRDFACYHCSQQMSAYKAAYARVKDAGAEVLVVLPGAKDVKGFIEKVGTVLDAPADARFTVPFPVVLDPGFSGCRAFSIAFDPRPEAFPFPVSEPATIVLGKDGHVVFSYHGTSPPDRTDVDLVLEVLAHGPPRDGVKPAKRDAAPPAPPMSTLPWQSYAEGMALARSRGQPVLLDIHALW